MPISYLMTLTRKQFMAISMPKSKVPSAGTSRRPCFSAWREGDGSPACVVVPGSRQPPPVPGKPLVSERGFQPEDPDPQSLKTWRRFQPAAGKHRLILVSAAQEVSPGAPAWSSPHWAAASVQSLPAARRLS